MDKTKLAWLLVTVTAVVGAFLSGAGQFMLDSAGKGVLDWRVLLAGAAGAGMMGVSAWIHRFAPAPTQAKDDKSDASKATTASIVFLVLFLAGCPAFWSVISKIEQGLPVLITAIDGAKEAEAKYIAQHPDDAAAKVAEAKLAAADAAAATLAHAAAAAKKAGSGDLTGAKADAVSAYKSAKDAVDALGRPQHAMIESQLVPVEDVAVALGAAQ